MLIRSAICRCGAVEARCAGVPIRVSVCHCLACQQRTGSAFGAQARFRAEQVEVSGETRAWTRIADSGQKVTYSFCPTCGSTVAYKLQHEPQITAIPLGAFTDPHFEPAPVRSIYEHCRHAWVAILGEHVRHED